MVRLATLWDAAARLLVIAAVLAVLLALAMLFGSTGGDARSNATSLPGSREFPAFVMELEIRRGPTETTAVFTYASAHQWLYEEFHPDGSLYRSQQLENGQVTLARGGFGKEVLPAGRDLTIPTSWFIDSDTVRARGARRIGTSGSFETRRWVECTPEVTGCPPGASFVLVIERAHYDLRTGVPVGHTVTINGVVDTAIRATRFSAD